MNYTRLIRQISLACFATFLMEGLNPQAAKAEWMRSLYAGNHDWANWSLSSGSYVLEASTFLNLGDVNVELYNAAGQRVAVGNALGSDTVFFSVPQGTQADLQVRYSMRLCANPMGACAVNLSVRRR